MAVVAFCFQFGFAIISIVLVYLLRKMRENQDEVKFFFLLFIFYFKSHIHYVRKKKIFSNKGRYIMHRIYAVLYANIFFLLLQKKKISWSYFLAVAISKKL